MPKFLLSFFLCLSAFLDAAPGPCADPAYGRTRGVVQPARSAFLALSDGVVASSPYAAGDVTAPGRPLLTLTSLEIEGRLLDLRGRVADLNLRLLDERGKAIVNRATLDDYTQRNGALSPEVRRRVARQDELEVLQSTIAGLKRNIQELETLKQRANGVFPYPTLLLSDPPRPAETVKAGATLFHYVFLDRLTLSIYGKPAAPPPRQAFVALGGRCLPLRYLRSAFGARSQSVELIFRGDIDRALTAEMAGLLRSPQPFVDVFHR